MNSFYNTTRERGRQLSLFEKKAETQEEIIMQFFERYRGRPLTPFEVLVMTGINAPVTSVRRALTNLDQRGLLVKTNEKRLGEYGRPNYTWGLAP